MPPRPAPHQSMGRAEQSTLLLWSYQVVAFMICSSTEQLLFLLHHSSRTRWRLLIHGWQCWILEEKKHSQPVCHLSSQLSSLIPAHVCMEFRSVKTQVCACLFVPEASSSLTAACSIWYPYGIWWIAHACEYGFRNYAALSVRWFAIMTVYISVIHG